MPLTAADIPPELFPRILAYVGTNDGGFRWNIENMDDESRRDLKSCSLVCLDWANRCRDILFTREIGVLSQDELKTLGFYACHGSHRLKPVQDLIRKWHLEQTWTSRSWCHMRYSTPFRPRYTRIHPYPNWGVHEDDDGYQLTLRGPIPAGLPVSCLRSPHWSLPRSLPACYTRFMCLVLSDIHFPSLLSLVKLIRHFKCLRNLR